MRLLFSARWMAMIVLGQVFFGNATYASLPSTPSVQEIKRIQERGELVIAMCKYDSPPFFMEKDGELSGLDIDIAKDIAKRLGVKVRFDRSASTYDDVVLRVWERKADIAISKLSGTLSRAAHVSFTNPYVTLSRALLVNRIQASRLGGKGSVLEKLNRDTVTMGVQKGTSFIDYAKASFPNSRMVSTFLTQESLDTAVIEGNVTFVLLDEALAKNFHHDHPSAGIKVQTLIRHEGFDPLAFAVNLEDEHLLGWLNLYLDTLERDGVLEQLRRKYLESQTWRQKPRTGGPQR